MRAPAPQLREPLSVLKTATLARNTVIEALGKVNVVCGPVDAVVAKGGLSGSA